MGSHGDNESDEPETQRDDDMQVPLLALVGITGDEEGDDCGKDEWRGAEK